MCVCARRMDRVNSFFFGFVFGSENNALAANFNFGALLFFLLFAAAVATVVDVV